MVRMGKQLVYTENKSKMEKRKENGQTIEMAHENVSLLFGIKVVEIHYDCIIISNTFLNIKIDRRRQLGLNIYKNPICFFLMACHFSTFSYAHQAIQINM